MEERQTNVDPQKVDRLLEDHDLYWNVKKEQLYTGTGIRSPYFGMVREDNDSFLGVAKKGYSVYQNWELAELVLRVAEELGQSVSNGGHFGGGKQVFVQVDLGEKLVGDNKVKRLASGINSFDGSTCLRWGGTNVVIVCQNTFWAAYNEMENCVRHTKNMREAVGESLRLIESINKYDTNLFEYFNRMADEKAKPEHARRVIQLVTGVDTNKTIAEAEEEYSTRKLNIAKDLTESIVGEMRGRETLWGLWNGLTHFTTHKAGTDKNREKSKAMGNLRQKDLKVFNYMVDLINS